MSLLVQLKNWARTIKRDLLALYSAARDDRVPWVAKLIAGVIAAYAFSPIDLIPDFIPVLGYLDDLLIVPLGVMLAIRLIPADLMTEHRARALRIIDRPTSRSAAVAIAMLWLLGLAISLWFFWRWLAGA